MFDHACEFDESNSSIASIDQRSILIILIYDEMSFEVSDDQWMLIDFKSINVFKLISNFQI